MSSPRPHPHSRGGSCASALGASLRAAERCPAKRSNSRGVMRRAGVTVQRDRRATVPLAPGRTPRSQASTTCRAAQSARKSLASWPPSAERGLCSAFLAPGAGQVACRRMRDHHAMPAFALLGHCVCCCSPGTPLALVDPGILAWSDVSFGESRDHHCRELGPAGLSTRMAVMRLPPGLGASPGTTAASCVLTRLAPGSMTATSFSCPSRVNVTLSFVG